MTLARSNSNKTSSDPKDDDNKIQVDVNDPFLAVSSTILRKSRNLEKKRIKAEGFMKEEKAGKVLSEAKKAIACKESELAFTISTLKEISQAVELFDYEWKTVKAKISEEKKVNKDSMLVKRILRIQRAMETFSRFDPSCNSPESITQSKKALTDKEITMLKKLEEALFSSSQSYSVVDDFFVKLAQESTEAMFGIEDYTYKQAIFIVNKLITVRHIPHGITKSTKTLDSVFEKSKAVESPRTNNKSANTLYEESTSQIKEKKHLNKSVGFQDSISSQSFTSTSSDSVVKIPVKAFSEKSKNRSVDIQPRSVLKSTEGYTKSDKRDQKKPQSVSSSFHSQSDSTTIVVPTPIEKKTSAFVTVSVPQNKVPVKKSFIVVPNGMHLKPMVSVAPQSLNDLHPDDDWKVNATEKRKVPNQHDKKTQARGGYSGTRGGGFRKTSATTVRSYGNHVSQQ